MKKLIATLLILTLSIFALVGCGDDGKKDDTVIRVGYITGPTGMGMAKLINDNTDGTKYAFPSTPYTSPSAAMDALRGGLVDVVCTSTDIASYVCSSTDDTIKILALNTVDNLFLVMSPQLASDPEQKITAFDKENLDNKKIYTIADGTPADIVEVLLEKYDINAEVVTKIGDSNITNPNQLLEKVIEGTFPIAVVPEPALTASIITSQSSGKPTCEIVTKLDTVWSEKITTPMAMGCVVANGKFVDDHKGVIDAFLAEYKSSIEFIANPENRDSAAQYIANAKIMGKPALAKAALGRLGNSITYIDGADMKNGLKAFCSLINVSAPKDSCFYEK